jgi:hypothetical protein
MIFVDTSLEIREGGNEEGSVQKVNSCMIYLIHCSNLCKCHNVPPHITTIKEKKYL